MVRSGCWQSRHQIKALLLGCVISTLPYTARAQSGDDNCQPLIDTSVILSVVTEQFYDRRFNGLNWSGEVAETVESVSCDDSPAQVSARVNTLLSRLGASHTAAFSTQDLEYWAFNAQFYFDSIDGYPLPFAGIWAQPDGEQWFVSAVLDGSVAANAGVQVGDQLLQLNNQAFTPTGFMAGENTLQLSSDGTTTRELQLLVTEQGMMRAFTEASAASARIFELGAGDQKKTVGYYRIWAGRDQIQRDFQTQLETFYESEADALIVDLRGGLGAVSADYLAPVRYQLTRKKIPVHFLIDDSVFAGKEVLASVVRRDALGKLVGSVTAGEHRPARTSRILGDRYFLTVATGSFPAPETGVIEAVGVAPDIEVESCRQYCEGSDPVLQASLQALASELASGPDQSVSAQQ